MVKSNEPDREDSEEVEDSEVKFLNKDGEWEPIRSEPRHTGDPDLDYLWDIRLDELNEILDDPENPLYEKATQVGTEIMAPLLNYATSVARPAIDRLNESLAGVVRATLPAANLPVVKLPRTSPAPVTHHVEGVVDASSSVRTESEVKGVTSESKTSEVRYAYDAAATALVERGVIAAEAHLRHAQEAEATRNAEAKKQSSRAKRTEIAGWIAAVGALGAVIATVILTPR